jgi:hypothetical protein
LNHLSRHAAQPKRVHSRHLKHLGRYLKGTASVPLILGSTKDNKLSAYCDATWHSGADGINTTGALFRFCGGTIHAMSHKQDCVTTSTCHSEMIALSTTSKYVVHLRQLLGELGFPQSEATIIYTDNSAAIGVASTFGTTKRTRHVDISHFLFQEYQSKNLIRTIHVPGTDQWADALTKLLHKDKLIKCRNFIMGNTQ